MSAKQKGVLLLLIAIFATFQQKGILLLLFSIFATSNGQDCMVTVQNENIIKPCIFPWTFHGKEYHGCIHDVDDPDGKYYCITEPLQDGIEAELGQWGYCPEHCPKEKSIDWKSKAEPDEVELVSLNASKVIYILNTSPMRPQSVSNASQMRSKCVSNMSPIHSHCVTNVSPMRS